MITVEILPYLSTLEFCIWHGITNNWIVAHLPHLSCCENCALSSNQSLFCWEIRLHSGGLGGSDAKTDGAEPITNVADENSDTGFDNVSKIARFCDEYIAKTHHKTGKVWCEIATDKLDKTIRSNLILGVICLKKFFIVNKPRGRLHGGWNVRKKVVYWLIHLTYSTSFELTLWTRSLNVVIFFSQVWKQKKVWEGFIKCCQRTKPQSFQVLLQLPAPQLKNAFENCPDLREPLLAHVKSFTPHQVRKTDKKGT